MTIASTATASDRGGGRAALGDAADDLAPAQVAARRQRRGRVEDRPLAHRAAAPLVAEAPPDPLRDQVRDQPDHQQDHAEVEERGFVQSRSSRRGTGWRSAPPACRRSRTARRGFRSRRRSPGRPRSPRPARGRGRAARRRRRRRRSSAGRRRARPPSGSRRGRWRRPAARAAPRGRGRGEIEAMIGMTMIVRIRLAVKTLAPVVCGGAEDRDEAERVVQARLDVFLDERGEDEDAPEAEDDAGDRRQHLDQRARSRRAPPLGASRLRKRPIEIAIGAPSSSAKKELTSGAEEQRAGAEVAEVRLPGRVGEEAEPELRDRRRGAVDDLVGDQDDQRRPRAARRAAQTP